MRLFHIARQPVDGVDVQVRVLSAAKSFFFFPGFNVLRGEAGNDGPRLIVFERHSMKISAIDCAAPSSEPKEEAFAESGPGLFSKKPGSCVSGGDTLVSPMNVGPIEGRLINADQGMLLSPGDCVVGVGQDDPGGKFIIVAEVMPPSECWFSINELPMLNAQQLGSTIVLSAGISDAGTANVYIGLRVD